MEERKKERKKERKELRDKEKINKEKKKKNKIKCKQTSKTKNRSMNNYSKKNEYENYYNYAYGNSKAYLTDFNLNDGSVRVWCVNWDKNDKTVIKNNWYDTLNVSISSKNYLYFIDNEAY